MNAPPPLSFDLVVIGAGPAGESAAELVASFGLRAVIVEKGLPGGVVTTTGGVPTKTLREAALYFTGFRDRDVYGVRLDVAPEIALDAIRARTRGVCDALQRLTRANIASHGIPYVEGSARLGPGRTVVVTRPGGARETLRGRVILVATGSRPARPSGLPDHPGICDTDTVLARGWLPRDLLIVGGGAVAVEFATIAHALGVRVTLVERGCRILSAMDGELSRRMAALFARWGVAVRLGTTVDRIDVAHANGRAGVEVRLSTDETFRPDTVLFAAGRRANTEELGTSEAGVAVDAKGRVVVDAHLQTTAPGIYAAGDVVRPTLASIAMEQGRAAVCHAFGIPFEGVVDPVPVSAVYGMPEIASAGLTEEACAAEGFDFHVGRSEFDAIPRGAIAGRGGLLKLIFLTSGRNIVGVHCFGDIASELVGVGQMAIRCGATIDTIANMSMCTPTYAHAYKYAAFDGLRRLPAERRRPRRPEAAPPA
jgi:NAD(P) transhydrogenase